MMDTRDRMEEVGRGINKNKSLEEDGRSLIHDYITREELLACTSCNACVQECPVSISPLDLILDFQSGVDKIDLSGIDANSPRTPGQRLHDAVEAAVAQWFWLQDVFPGKDQWNGIHEALIRQWKKFQYRTGMSTKTTCPVPPSTRQSPPAHSRTRRSRASSDAVCC